MSCNDLRNKFVLNKSSCNNLCDDSNGHPSKCNFNCDMECAHAGSSGGGGSSGNYQMVYDNCYSQNCGSSDKCDNLAQVLDCCNSNCNKNPVCMDVCASNNANKGRPPAPADNSKAYGNFTKCVSQVGDDDNENNKAKNCCNQACGNDVGCAQDCYTFHYNKPKYPVDHPPFHPSPDDPPPVDPSPVDPSPVKPTILVKKIDGLFSQVTTPMWWGIGLGIAALVILIISFIISSRRKAVVSQFGFRFY
jgi:hypothetical protein